MLGHMPIPEYRSFLVKLKVCHMLCNSLYDAQKVRAVCCKRSHLHSMATAAGVCRHDLMTACAQQHFDHTNACFQCLCARNLFQLLLARLAVSMQVTGTNLVPFTLQKQNVVAATVSDQLRFASVFSVRLISVDQNSPEAGHHVSSAELSLIVQQDDSALYVGEVG